MSLYRCATCDIFFKSKKGYDGHNINQHSPKVVDANGKAKSMKDTDGMNKVRIYYEK